MPVERYGVLVGRPLETVLDTDLDGGCHLHILMEAKTERFNLAVNILSSKPPHALKFGVKALEPSDLLTRLGQLGPGAYESDEPGLGLDYQRQALIGADAMTLVPASKPGPGNDLADHLTTTIQHCLAHPSARLVAFGSFWGPEPDRVDGYFGFSPGRGLHNVHMNQGNGTPFEDDNGVYQDGALFLVTDTGAVGLFLAFATQTWNTDAKGNAA